MFTKCILTDFSYKKKSLFFAGGVGHGRDGIAELVALSFGGRHRL